ncbi:Translation initiation factor IF-2 [Fundidesulfovibrio magnetotacticus]|uniref:Translation initiation factor IF-2 n=1 Tax=Fundidesulfovibrio magnetotacticus TaxID=2730080 RepID=A0A6V8LJ12_9BACT|nr:translation initiation factor IF-2 [Fundidesulfovibrio magnetotacticus]GFK92713.1 Translation initiation factor IF-2 [Fundidesulfovibrio magnetotacticus]
MTKLRVRDLAKELRVSNKDIYQALRELDIRVSSDMATLEDDQIAQVRSRISQGLSKSEVVQSQSQPGVVVRRRRHAAESHAAASGEPQAQAAPSVQEPPQDVPGAPKEAPAQAAEQAPRSKPRRKMIETPPARIISQPEPEPKPDVAELPVVHEHEFAAPEPEAPKAQAQDEPQAPVAAQAPEAPETAEVPQAPEAVKPQDEAQAPEAAKPAEAAEEAPAAEAGAEKRAKKPKREVAIGPQVRIISMPEPRAPEAPRPAASQPGGYRPGGPGGPGGPRPGGPGGQRPGGPGGPRPGGPGGPRPGGPGGPRPGGPGGFDRPAPAPVPESDDRKRRKDKRVVEFGAQAPSDDGDRRGGGKRRIGEIQDRTGRGGKQHKKKKSGDQVAQIMAAQAQAQPQKAVKRKIRMEDAIRVSEMARQMNLKAQDLMKVLLSMGMFATINQSLDYETAVLIAAEFGYEVEKSGFDEDQFLTAEEQDAPETLKPRPPVVTIMGHVDHGKTSLLDAIRSTNVVMGEAGGITQHIGAYHVATPRGDVVFLDTPGHEAFTAMRARGAKVTDIVVLVVAADDGVMDQTREAINHSKAAGVPIVVAVNKMDKPGAEPDRVKRELSEHGLVSEDWGGDTIYAHVSAKQRTGLDGLLEMILLQAEVLDLKANPDKRAKGHIIEAKLDKGRGPVATVLIEEGTLNQGDAFVCGLFSGRVRAMFDDQGRKIKHAGPAMPVEVQGFEGVPEAGEVFSCVEDEKVARRIAETRMHKQRERELGKATKLTLETFLASRGEAEAQELKLVLKADVQGSQEAIAEALGKLSGDKVKVRMIHAGTGAITESDVLLAAASGAVVIGFNIRPSVKVKELAERENVDLRFYDIIYKLVDEIKAAMTGMLAPVLKEQYLGQAEVRQVFSVPKVGMVAGCGVLDGKIGRNSQIRLLRDSVVIYTGKLASLKRFKDDVKEVTKGYECGMGLENFNDIKVGDVIEAFETVEEKDTLD